MPNRVIHFDVQADDVGRAKDFYEKTFGWKIEKIMAADDQGGMDYWGITTGPDGTPGINGGLSMRPKEMDKRLNTFSDVIAVDNLDQAMMDIKQNGGIIFQEKMEIPTVGWFAGGQDTEGNKFGLMQATGWQAR